jgi:WS/DGAT/MGAT family acyltransferase
MHLGALLVFGAAAGGGAAPRAAVLAAALRNRVAAVPKMRRRLTPLRFPPGAAAWVDDPDFDPAAHVHEWVLDAPGQREELAARTAELLATPLDRSRPLWELHVFDGLADSGVVVLAKIHHALADGLRAVVMGLSLFDDPDGRHDRQPVVVPTSPGPPTNAAKMLMPALNDLLSSARPLLDPRTSVGEVVKRAGQVRESLGISASVLQRLGRPAPASPLNATLGPDRRFAMLRADLDDVHRVRKTHGGTVNDVLLAVISGGLRHWLTERAYPVQVPLRALVPVSRPHPNANDPAGNRLSGYLVELPVNEQQPLARLQAIRNAMRLNKTAGPTRGPGAFPLLANRLPSLVHRLATPFAGPTASLLFNTVVTHVPLPDLPLTLAGARLAEIYPIVPLAPGQALGIAISTYHGVAHIGLHADHAAIPDLDQFGLGIGDALTELLEA